MLEILRSWFTKYRFIPYSQLRLDMEANDPLDIEEHIHKVLAHKRYVPEEKVQGHTEMFTGIDEFRVIQYLKHCGKAQKIKTKLTAKDYNHLGQFLSP